MIICKTIHALEKDSKHNESVNVNEIKGSIFGLNSKITIKAASGENIPFEGYVHLDLKVGVNSMQVPFLVTNLEMEIPILGFNVISHFANQGYLSRAK